MRTRIPLPQLHNEAFSDALDYFEKIQSRKQNKPLIEAQTEEAKAKALKAKMFANLINQALGMGGEESQGQNGNPMQMQSGQPREGSGILMPEKNPPKGFEPLDQKPVGQENHEFANMPETNSYDASSNAGNAGNGAPKNNKAKELLYALGMLKETPQEQATREQATAWKKELGASDIKSVEDWNKKITSSQEMMPVLENVREIITDPKIQEVYQHPEYMNYDVAYAKRFNKDPDVQQGLTSLATNVKSIYSTMGSEFKGAFREFELNLFNAAAPTEKDSLNQLIAKTNTLMHLRNLAIKRYSLADQIVRGSNGTISPANALEIARKQVDTKQERDKVKQEYKQLEEAKKQRKTPKITTTTSNGSNSVTSTKYESEIYSPHGELVAHGTKKQAAEFLAKHPGYTQKEINDAE